VGKTEFSPDGGMVATLAEDRWVRIAFAANGRQAYHSILHQAALADVKFGPQSDCLATIQRDGLVRVYQLREPMWYRTVPTRIYGSQAKLSPDGKYVCPLGAASPGHSRSTLSMLHTATGERAGRSMVFDGQITATSWRPDQQAIAVAIHDRQKGRSQVHFVDWRTNEPVRPPLEIPTSAIFIEYSRDGKVLVAVGQGHVAFLELERGEVAATSPLEGFATTSLLAHRCVTFSPDDRYVATAGVGNAAYIWDRAGQRLHTLPHNAYCRDVVFSRSGRYALTSSSDKTARVWDVQTGRELSVLDHPDWVMCAEFSDDERQVVTGGRDQYARIWNWQEKTLGGPMLKHEGEVYCLRLLGKEIVTVANDGRCRLFDAASGEQLMPPLLISGWIRGLEISSDRRYAVLSSDDTTILDLHALAELAPIPSQELPELQAGKTIHETLQVQPLSSEEWLARCQT
jgi:WD40 repeat protein